MVRKKKIRLKKSSELTADEVLQILVARYLRVKNVKIPDQKEVPVMKEKVFHSISDYDQKMVEIRKVERWNETVKALSARQKELKNRIEKQIVSFLPKYKWFVVQVKDESYAVGISSSNWGGHNYFFWVEPYYPGQDNSHLKVLKHINYT